MNQPTSSPLTFLPPFLFAEEGQLRAPGVERLAKVLAKYERRTVVTLVAGMLTAPDLQANCYRLELLAHLAAANCKGKLKPSRKHLSNWLNRQLGVDTVAWMEDPPEDVFVSNVVTNTGDYMVLGGMWEVPASATSLLMECVLPIGGNEQLQWLGPARALLQLSDLVLKRAKLRRWHIEPSTPKRPIAIPPATLLKEWASRVVFIESDFVAAGIAPALLERFVLKDAEASTLMKQSNQESTLHAKPLLRFGAKLVLSLPTAVTYAVRRYLVSHAAELGQLNPLQDALMSAVLSRVTIMMSGSNHGVDPVLLPPVLTGIPGLCQSLVYRVGLRRVIHLLVLPDSLAQFASIGLLRPTEFSERDETAIHNHLSDLRKYIDHTFEPDSAHTLVILGHLGQGYMLSPPANRSRWTFQPCRLNDLETLLRASDAPLDKLILMSTQRASMEERGLHLPNINGLLNLYAYWVDQGCSLRVSDIPHNKPANLQIATDHVMEFRRARQEAVDEHCEQTVGGSPAVVVRANSDSVYASVKAVPAYVSIPHLKAGHLTFCIPRNATVVWVTVLLRSGNAILRRLAYDLWENLQFLMYRALEVLRPSLALSRPAIELILDMRSVVTAQTARDNPTLSSALDIQRHREWPVAKLSAQPGFLRSFSGVGNSGERKLVSQMIRALTLLSDQDELTEKECDEAALNVLGGDDAKVLHLFETFKPLEYMLASDRRRVFRRPCAQVGAAIRSAFDWMQSSDKKQVLDKRSSCKALNAAVNRLVEQLVKKLARFDRALLITELLHAHESLLRDKQRWRSTARAVRALYGIESGTNAAERAERERAEASVTLRTLVEAAVCECPVSGGLSLDGHSVDELYGLAYTLIELGRDSETIYHDLASEGITIFPSGAYGFTADVLKDIGGAYSTENFRTGYEAAAKDYEHLYCSDFPGHDVK